MNRNLHNAMMAQYATPKVSGDGLLSWDKGIKCVIPSVKLYGAANQDTLSGSNFLNPALYEFESGYTKNGVTLTINDDGSITASGTPTVESGRIMMLYLGEYIDVLKNGETYIENGCWFVVKKSDGTQTWPGIVTVDTDTMVSIRPYFEIALDDYSDGMTRYIAINKGTTRLPWERYCGGIPAPNPSYPIMPVCNDGVVKATSPDGSWDGGQATAPELWAIQRTDIRDEWDAQTGWGVRRVKKLVLTPDLKWYIYDKTGVTENNFAYLTGIINTVTSKNGMFSHGTYQAVEISASDICAYMYVSGIFRIRTGHESTLADFKEFLQGQIDAGTPVTVCYPLKEPEPFYHAPARLTQPNGPGQIIQVSGSVPDCTIDASYLTHS